MVKNKPVLSLYGSAAFPKKWMELYESLTKNNDISFEIVFSGPRSPKFALPDNFKFIGSKVKPAQCCEIAARNSVGEFLVGSMSDDVELTPHALDKLYEKYTIYNDTNVITSTLQAKLDRAGDMHPVDDEYYRYWWDKPDSPPMPILSLMARSKYEELGGIDSRFIALCGDRDVIMRFYAQGGRVEYCEDVFLAEKPFASKKLKKQRLTKLFGMKYDMKMLDSLWVTDRFEVTEEYMKENRMMACIGRISEKRLDTFIPFNNKDIQIRSQGMMIPLCYKRWWV